MRCPWCGSPVKISGNRWECGFCGDSGFLAESNEPALTYTMTVSYSVDYYLTNILEEMRSCLRIIVPEHADTLADSLMKAVIYEIAKGLSEAPRILPPEKEKQLKAFIARSCPGLLSADSLLNAPQNWLHAMGPAGRLTSSFCGSFYSSLIESGIDDYALDALMDVFIGLYRFYCIFRSEQFDEHFIDFMSTHEFPESDRQYRIFLNFWRQKNLSIK